MDIFIVFTALIALFLFTTGWFYRAFFSNFSQGQASYPRAFLWAAAYNAKLFLFH